MFALSKRKDQMTVKHNSVKVRIAWANNSSFYVEENVKQEIVLVRIVDEIDL